MNSEIYHCVFTHATDGWSGSGGRFEPVEPNAAELLPAEALIELQSFLGKLIPESKGPAWAMRRFSAGSDRYACFIASYGGFKDAAGRNGLLNHARVVRLEPDAVWFDPLPLVALAEEFPIDEVQRADPLDRLQAYLGKLADENVVTVRALSRQELKPVPREALREVLLTTISAIGDKRGKRRVRAPKLPLTQLARAWAALPVGLQRRSAWAHGANDGVPVQLIWSDDPERTNQERPSDAAIRCVDQYLGLLLDSNYDLRQLVLDEELDLAAFTQLVQRASATAMTTTAALLPEKTEMTKKNNRPEPRSRGRSDSEPLDAAELNRQYETMFESLKEYVDLRLEGYEAGRAAAKVAPRGSDVPLKTSGGARTVPGWKAALDRYGIAAAALAAGILLTLGVLALTGVLKWGRGTAAARPEQQQEVAGTVTAEDEPEDAGPVPVPQPPQATEYLRTLVTQTETTGKWPEAFQALTETEPRTVAALVDDTIGHQTTGPNTRKALAALRDRLNGTGKKLDRTDRSALRNYLLQYIAAEVTAGQPEVIVDDKMNDLKPAVMQRVIGATGATGKLAEPSEPVLQSEIILRWLESHPS
ncbi:MAG TPA: hypothetical protein VEK57_22455 [Thermoanaerobaculia bacterium]|nr:hypothetical protein [Thermoanaerobaculia bacterium]